MKVRRGFGTDRPASKPERLAVSDRNAVKSLRIALNALNQKMKTIHGSTEYGVGIGETFDLGPDPVRGCVWTRLECLDLKCLARKASAKAMEELGGQWFCDGNPERRVLDFGRARFRAKGSDLYAFIRDHGKKLAEFSFEDGFMEIRSEGGECWRSSGNAGESRYMAIFSASRRICTFHVPEEVVNDLPAKDMAFRWMGFGRLHKHPPNGDSYGMHLSRLQFFPGVDNLFTAYSGGADKILGLQVSADLLDGDFRATRAYVVPCIGFLDGEYKALQTQLSSS